MELKENSVCTLNITRLFFPAEQRRGNGQCQESDNVHNYVHSSWLRGEQLVTTHQVVSPELVRIWLSSRKRQQDK